MATILFEKGLNVIFCGFCALGLNFEVVNSLCKNAKGLGPILAVC